MVSLRGWSPPWYLPSILAYYGIIVGADLEKFPPKLVWHNRQPSWLELIVAGTGTDSALVPPVEVDSRTSSVRTPMGESL